MKLLSTTLILLVSVFVFSQSLDNHWSKSERKLRYRPDQSDFVIQNGDKKFNRALYGTNTAFRVEAGDLPEFAFYMPGFGGNLQFGIIKGNKGKWLTEADSVEARYRPGAMIYTIKDALLDNGRLIITVLALADKEGGVFRVENQSGAKDISLVWAFGGATGKKFRRDGDLNTDPDSVFYLKPENCADNLFEFSGRNMFFLQYGKGEALAKKERQASIEGGDAKGLKQIIVGVTPEGSSLGLSNAELLLSPKDFLASVGTEFPVLAGQIAQLKKDSYYFSLFVPRSRDDFSVSGKTVSTWFDDAELVREKLASRIQVKTPDPFINTLGATLGIAADAIWEYPTYLHGAIGWRMRLNGWRGPYTADPLGWHDRAIAHFSSYAKSQVLSPETGPIVPDEKRNWARQEEKMGNALYTNGYICRNPNGDFRPHHYDMNLVFIDALLRHFRWTGDLNYVKEMWPVIKRHLAWEKRNFDGDNDGLYDAYCCIWASDALEYGGGGVAHSSAYNYFSNKMAAELTALIGEDATPYKQEADKIFEAIFENLWLDEKGWFAEYKDWCGEKRTHDAAALWTIYHVLDSEVANPFQSWQSTKYIDEEIPRLPVKANGLEGDGYYVHSTTNWQPYDWSINNVVMAENLHTALAYWQSGRIDEAYNLWKSTLLDAMYLGGSPGNFVQLSFLDAARGEMYRDFADEVGMTARSLVEGLFGIHPDALKGELIIKPGLPSHWEYASLVIPDIELNYERSGDTEKYTIIPSFSKPLKLALKLPALKDHVAGIKLNGKTIEWLNDSNAVQNPAIIINCGILDSYNIEINWKGKPLEKMQQTLSMALGDKVNITFENARVLKCFDPQKFLISTILNEKSFSARIQGLYGKRTCFVKLKQADMQWWMPVNVLVNKPVEITAPKEQERGQIQFVIKNNTSKDVEGDLYLNNEYKIHDNTLALKPGEQTEVIVKKGKPVPGSNLITFHYGNETAFGKVINWDIDFGNQSGKLETINIDTVFNDMVPHIFKNEYKSPRWPYPTLQLPKHGIGNWCYNNIHPDIDDSGLRKLAGDSGRIRLKEGIVFITPGTGSALNVGYVSLWDNYKNEFLIPLKGKGKHLYLMMTGSTNPMQSRIVNGVVRVEYADGSFDELELINPLNWWPIEQDYFHDGYAFNIETPFPPRIHLKTGLITRQFSNYSSIQGFSNRIIEGGAATVLDMPLNPAKEIKGFKLKALSNEVVIGLMAATILRD